MGLAPRDKLSKKERLDGLQRLEELHAKRFDQLEQIAWRINFSVWAALGGLAYLWGGGHLDAPDWMRCWTAYVYAPIVRAGLHGAAFFQLNRQMLRRSEISKRSWPE